jgi:hypothetical protein
MKATRTRAAFAVVLAFSVACSSGLVVQGPTAVEPAAPPAARLFLVGDGGVASFGDETAPPGSETRQFHEIVDETVARAVRSAHEDRLLQTLLNEAQNRDHLTPGAVPLIVWLGDNVYEHGVPRDPGAEGLKEGTLSPVGRQYVQAAATIAVQAEVALAARANAVFVPGNHDWDAGVTRRGPDGRVRVIEEGEVLRRYVEGRRAQGVGKGLDIRMLPPGGCPGPAMVELPIAPGARVRVAAIDTEWLLTNEPDRGCPSSGSCGPCTPGTREAVYAALREITRQTQPEDALIVVGHHPLKSYGMHGGQFFGKDPRSWLRWAALSAEDAPHPNNLRMRAGLADAFDAARGQPLLYAGGHDHNLQLIRMPSGPYVAVSGSAAKTDTVRAGGGTRFAHSEHGYMVVDFFEDGRVLLHVVEVPKGDSAIRRLPPFELRPGRGAAPSQSSGIDPEQ